MRYKGLRCAVLTIALSVPLGGCLEVATRTMNRQPIAPQATPCPHGVRTEGESVGYGCASTAPAAR